MQLTTKISHRGRVVCAPDQQAAIFPPRMTKETKHTHGYRVFPAPFCQDTDSAHHVRVPKSVIHLDRKHCKGFSKSNSAASLLLHCHKQYDFGSERGMQLLVHKRLFMKQDHACAVSCLYICTVNERKIIKRASFRFSYST